MSWANGKFWLNRPEGEDQRPSDPRLELVPGNVGELLRDVRLLLLNQKGQVVGRLRTVGRNRVNILELEGWVVAREINGMTLDQNGRLRGFGKQGLRVLGMSQRRYEDRKIPVVPVHSQNRGWLKTVRIF